MTRLVARFPLDPSSLGGVLFLWTGDANGDGRSDLVFATGSFPPFPERGFVPRLFLQTQDGGFTEAEILGPRRSLVHPRDAAVGDVNGDGLPDLVLVGHGYDTAPFAGERSVLLLGQPDGRWRDRSEWLPERPAFTHSVAIADVNGDGFADVFLGNIWSQGETPPMLLFGGPNGLAEAWLPPRIGARAFAPDGFRPIASLLADLDGDGRFDLVAGGDVTGMALFRGRDGSRDGRWFVEDPVILPPGVFGPGGSTITVDVAAADLDRDGRLDLILSQTKGEPFYQGRAIQILLQQPDGRFADRTAEVLPDFAREGRWLQFVLTGDLDGDGYVDLLGQTGMPFAADTPFVWLNDGMGGFRESFAPARLPVPAHGVAASDSPGSMIVPLVEGGNTLSLLRYEFPVQGVTEARGTAGVDVFRLPGERSAWTVARAGGDLRVDPNAGGGGFLLRDVERLAFDDGTLAFDTDGLAGAAFRLYRACLARAPDSPGLGYWIRTLEAGASLADLSWALITSDEFATKFGPPSQPTNVIAALYRNILGRSPDPEGYAYWRDQVDRGVSLVDVVYTFAESEEHRLLLAPDLTNGIWFV